MNTPGDLCLSLTADTLGSIHVTTTSPRRALSGGSAIAVAMGLMNVATYGFQMVAARLLGPQHYGALAALMNLVLVVSVLALALQANAARRIAAEPSDVHAVESAIRRVGWQASLVLAAVALVLTPVINWALRLDSLPTALLIGFTALPLTLMGYQAGVLQGERRWLALSLVYLSAGVPRLVIGTSLLLWNSSTFWAMTGVMLGSWAPVLVGELALRRPRGIPHNHAQERHTAHEVWRETVRNSHALLAFFALSNVDILVARNAMHAHEAGLYAAGLIMAKAVLFLPQFVVVLAFPSMGSEETRRDTLIKSLGAVAMIGLVVAAVTSVLSGVALVFIGGDQYAEVQSVLWAFALLGAVLAMLQLVVYSVLARQAKRSIYLIWAGLAALVIMGRTMDTFTQLLVTVVAIDAVLLALLLGITVWRMRAAPAPVRVD